MQRPIQARRRECTQSPFGHNTASASIDQHPMGIGHEAEHIPRRMQGGIAIPKWVEMVQ